MTDYYAILGVPRNATSIEIRDAYLKLARDTHPDKVKDPEARKKAEDVFKNVTAAYDTLSKDRSRRDYSAKLPAVSETKHQTTTSTTRNTPPVVQGRPLPPRESPTTPTSPPETGLPKTPSPLATGRSDFDALSQGIEAFKNADYHTAVQLLNRAVLQDDKSARAHAMLGLAMAKNPNWVRDALNHMETASRLEPKNVAYLCEVALLLHSQGLKLRAKRALENAMAINSAHPDVARALKEIPLAAPEPESPPHNTAETTRGLFDRLRKR